MKKLLTVVMIVMVGAMLTGATAFACNKSEGASTASACQGKTAGTAAKMASASDGAQTIVLNVSNMTCGSCVNHVTKALASVEGVSDVKVSLEKGTAEVQYAAAKVKPEMLTAAVVKAGYPAEMANATTADAKACGSHAAKMAGTEAKACEGQAAKMAGADGKKCDPAACAKMANMTEKEKADCAKMIADGKCDPAACAKMAAEGKCDPKACVNAKMTSATETTTETTKAKGAACDVTKQAACTGHGK